MSMETVIDGGNELTGVPHRGQWSDTGRIQLIPEKRWPGRESGLAWSALVCLQDQAGHEWRSPMRTPTQPTEKRKGTIMPPQKRRTENLIRTISASPKPHTHVTQLYKTHPFLTESNGMLRPTGHGQHLDTVNM